MHTRDMIRETIEHGGLVPTGRSFSTRVRSAKTLQRRLPLIVVLLFGLCALASGSHGATRKTNELLSRPRPVDQPTPVRIGIYIVDIASIDDARQTITVDLLLWVSWKDPRLVTGAIGLQELELNEVWNPRILFIGERKLEKKLPDSVYADEEGTLLYRQRFFGEISSPTELADFPFDEQVLRIHAVAGGFTLDEVELTVEPTRIGRSARLSVVDWKIGEVSARVLPFEYTADNRVFPSCIIEVRGTRYAGYYVWKVIFPLILVVFMSWTVFWIDPSHAGPQISVATTSILTLIAYQFVLGRLVPELSYLTRLDLFTIGSTGLVFLALVEVVTTTALAAGDRLALAKRIDYWARIVFPASYLVVIAVSFWI